MVSRSSRDRRSVLPHSSSESQSHSERNQKKVRRNVDSFVAHRCDSSLDNRQIGGHLQSLHGRWSEECTSAGNLSCLLYSTRLVEKIKKLRWQCLDCQRCVVCPVRMTIPYVSLLLFLASHDDLFFFQLLFSDLCDAAIHPKCSTSPPLHHVSKGKFVGHSYRERRHGGENRRRKSTATISWPVVQLIYDMSNFFLPKKKKKSTTSSHKQWQ